MSIITKVTNLFNQSNIFWESYFLNKNNDKMFLILNLKKKKGLNGSLSRIESGVSEK